MSNHPRRRKKKRSKRQVGLPPGSLVRRVEGTGIEGKIQLISYSQTEIEEESIESKESLQAVIQQKNDLSVWLNIIGLDNIKLIEEVGKTFTIHPLLLEDAINTDQRPKYDEYEDHLGFTLKMLNLEKESNSIQEEQITFVLGNGFLVSFQEREGDVFDPVRLRLENAGGRIRAQGPDYLMYALIDVVVDHYFLILEDIGDRIDQLEDLVFEEPTEAHLKQIQEFKYDILLLRRSIFPLRDAVSRIQHDATGLISETTRRYLNDVYDHIIQLIEILESLREINSGLKDIYMSSVSYQMNKVVQLLTIISTIFIPLTFIAGIYGMNFTYMPELEWRNGYFIILGVMAALVLWMIFFFRRKKWL